jgi:sporulation integral membrane protein YtvI
MISDDISTKLSSAVGNMITSALSSLAEGIASLVTALPQGFLFLLVTLISLVYFSLDYDRISDFIKSILPQKFVSAIEGIKSKSIRMLGKYLRSYSLIIFVTYMILLIGLLILRIKNALFVALFVSVLDILPIIGVGTLLIPWGILEIAIGNKFVGIGLIILFLVNAIVRQFLEPKIIGKSLNIHPIATLIMIYIGYSLFGIMGLIILPAIAIVLSIVLGGNKTAEIG